MKANKTGRPTQQETPNKRVREVSTSPQSPDNKKKSNTMTDAVNILRAIESLRNEVAGKFEELKGKLEVVETAVTNWNAEKEVLMASIKTSYGRLQVNGTSGRILQEPFGRSPPNKSGNLS